MAKKVNPSDIVSVAALRKAMGIAIPPTPETDSDLSGTDSVDLPGANPPNEPPNGDMPDLESELRQFLESESSLTSIPLRDDKTIEEILME